MIYFSNKLESLKEIQSLRKRPNGVNVIGLALGTKVTVEDEVVAVSINIFYPDKYTFLYAFLIIYSENSQLLFTERSIQSKGRRHGEYAGLKNRES